MSTALQALLCTAVGTGTSTNLTQKKKKNVFPFYYWTYNIVYIIHYLCVTIYLGKKYYSKVIIVIPVQIDPNNNTRVKRK